MRHSSRWTATVLLAFAASSLVACGGDSPSAKPAADVVVEESSAAVEPTLDAPTAAPSPTVKPTPSRSPVSAVAPLLSAAPRKTTAAPAPRTTTTAPKPKPTTAAPNPRAGCDPAYPTVCIPPAPPDLDCGDISFRRFKVLAPDPHGFDGNDGDGLGCES